MEKILEKKLPRRCGSAAKEILTVFQFWSYLEAEGVSELETHVTELAEEGRFLYVCFLPSVWSSDWRCKLVHLPHLSFTLFCSNQLAIWKQFSYFKYRYFPLSCSHYHLICILSCSFHRSLLPLISPHKHWSIFLPLCFRLQSGWCSVCSLVIKMCCWKPSKSPQSAVWSARACAPSVYCSGTHGGRCAAVPVLCYAALPNSHATERGYARGRGYFWHKHVNLEVIMVCF